MNRSNPFHELYVTEDIQSDRFVRLFSPFFVQHALSLFQSGNVILTGLPGSGKSMLLSLLTPEVRLSYLKAETEFPIPTEFCNFIGAGINLRQCGAFNFGQRVEIIPGKAEYELFPLYFGDFLNYWIVADLLNTITIFSDYISKNTQHKNIYVNKLNLNEFIIQLSENDCWFGYLNDINNFDDFKKKVAERITKYRAYLNHNIHAIPEGIKNTKTIAGEPISITANLLRKSGVVSDELKIFIRIDQFEDLRSIGTVDNHAGEVFQQIIHKILGMRDPNVFYRIGARKYSWSKSPKIYGTASTLEKDRDFNILDIDEKLKRKEDKRTWIFPEFSKDIFERRVSVSGLIKSDTEKSALDWVYGKDYSHKEKAKKYTGKSSKNILSIDPAWPKPWVEFLTSLAKTDPLSAKFGEAWARQRNKENIVNNVPDESPYPWEKDEKIYWIKERNQQAHLQIASRNKQPLIWCGVDDILALSGGNILTFISVCQHIWDVWLRDNREHNSNLKVTLPQIDKSIQSAGILETSKEWYEKISNAHGGANRQKFIRFIGVTFYRNLIDDKSMSYPGNNGFSLSVDEFEKEKSIKMFLRSAENYGDLTSGSHTSKTKGEKRIKWYLNPILSPYFKIPHVHTKEPMYITIADVKEWHDLSIEGGINSEISYTYKRRKKSSANKNQITIFDDNLKDDTS